MAGPWDDLKFDPMADLLYGNPNPFGPRINQREREMREYELQKRDYYAGRMGIRDNADLLYGKYDAERMFSMKPKFTPRDSGNAQVLVLGRQGGKTKHFLDWLFNDPDRIALVATHQEIQHLKREYLERFGHKMMNLVVTVEKWRPEQFEGREVGVDNLDHVLQYFLRTPVAAMTITGRDWDEPVADV